MAGDEADISPAASDILAEMIRNGLSVPAADDLESYRAETRAGYEPGVHKAIETFDGRIEDSQVTDIDCTLVTPRSWARP